MTVPAQNIAAMAAAAAISIAVPIVLAIIWGKRQGGRAVSFFIGAGVFFLFAMVLEQGLHYFCLIARNPVSAFIMGRPWAYAIYGALAAGIFEETGRYAAFRLALRERGRAQSVMYGIGHGGIEAILLSGQTMLVYIAFSFMVNSGATSAAAGLIGNDSATYDMLINTVAGTSPGVFLLGGVERLIAMVLHISLSVVVYASVKQEGKGYLYPIAILLHAGANIAAGMYQAGLVSNILLVEVVIALFTVLVAIFALKLYRTLPKDDPGDEPKQRDGSRCGYYSTREEE